MSLLAEGLTEWFSESELKRLGSATVGIAGAGGLGSNVAFFLARSGIRRFLVVDGDFVEPSNLNRQTYWPEDVGKPKIVALRERLCSLEPDIWFDGRMEWLRPATAPALFAGCDIVVEALDKADIKAELCSSLLKSGYFVVAGSGMSGYGLPPLQVRRLGENFVCVGDFVTGVSEGSPTLAPRVAQAAAMQADAVLEKLLGKR